MTIRVFLVDDHPLFLAGVRTALQDSDAVVVGEATTGMATRLALHRPDTRADVVLMGLHLPDGSAIELARAVAGDAAPGTVSPRVLAVSAAEDDQSVVAALRAGVHGYIVRNASRDELLRAVHTVAEGGAVFSPGVAARLAGYFSALHELPGRVAFPDLTDRERQILDLLARGYNNRRIARELLVAEKTVRNHVSRVLAKLQVSKRTEAAVLARDAGLGG
jgi:DNA-binding NarL/FixJ family response regulator